MKHYKIFATIACLLVLTFASMHAQQVNPLDVPRTISYQGILTSTDGTPLPDGAHSIIVTLYGDQAGTDVVWRDSYDVTTVNGVFNLYLGSNASLPSPLQLNRPLWVGTAVDGDREMFPLTALTSSPYALNIPDRAVTTDKLADGAVTAEKVDMDYVAGIAINGRSITGAGTTLNIEVSDGVAVDYDEQTGTLRLSNSKSSAEADREKHESDPSVLDFTDGSENWLGRNGGANLPFFQVPLGTYNTLAGGFVNQIRTQCDYSTIGGGRENMIDTNANYGFIGGGYSNDILRTCNYGVIGGGSNNVIAESADSATIGGGASNYVSGHGATISGGDNNEVLAIDGTIGGGDSNMIAALGVDATIAGGQNNVASNDDVAIGGGDHNTASGVNATIGGGEENTVSSDYATIGGGDSNRVLLSTWATIAGGQLNRIDSSANWSVIGGGDSNKILYQDAQHATIAGGQNNKITNFNGAIGGGRGNIVTGHSGTIAGGHLNLVSSTEGSIGGGRENEIRTGSEKATIGGGGWNRVEQNIFAGTIGGGSGNVLLALSDVTLTHPTIPGGDNLIAQSWAQTVIGGFNHRKGKISTRSLSGNWNAPIFIIGNGNSFENRSNAFEVSYNGHSIVFDVNGTGGATGATGRGVVRGGTYVDNVIYGWAEVTAAGAIADGCADFGIDSIANPVTGTYRVFLNPIGPVDSNEVTNTLTIDCGAVVATLSSGNDPEMGPPAIFCQTFIATSKIKDNMFDVYIGQYDPGKQECNPVNLPFKFHVTGRPHN